MFASKTMAEHLVRGALAAMALAGAALCSARIWPLLVLGPLALVLLRGCPTCWTVGLVELIGRKLGRSPVTAGCPDGRCDARSSAWVP